MLRLALHFVQTAFARRLQTAGKALDPFLQRFVRIQAVRHAVQAGDQVGVGLEQAAQADQEGGDFLLDLLPVALPFAVDQGVDRHVGDEQGRQQQAVGQAEEQHRQAEQRRQEGIGQAEGNPLPAVYIQAIG